MHIGGIYKQSKNIFENYKGDEKTTTLQKQFLLLLIVIIRLTANLVVTSLRHVYMQM